MASGDNPASQANLTRAGGDRYKDKRALLAVIRGALESGLTDAEIRKFHGLFPGAEVSLAKRKRMARLKAGAFYAGLVHALRTGAGELLVGYVQGPDGIERKIKGGVNFGGIMKFGAIGAGHLKIDAYDIYGEKLGERGVVPYQLEIPEGLEQFGHRGNDGVLRAWFYTEGASVERVKWVAEKLDVGIFRRKAIVMDRFWCELNGLSWEDLGAI